MKRRAAIAVLLLVACGPRPVGLDAGRDAGEDGGPAAIADAGDSGVPDAAVEDAGDGGSDGAVEDGGPTDAGPDGGSLDAGDGGIDGGFAQAPHDAFPQIPNHGGAALAHPAIVSVTFAGDPLAAQALAYDQWLAASAWLSEVGADYGVGNGPSPVAVTLDGGPPPWNGLADVVAFLGAGFDGGTLPAPAAGDGRIYVLHLPATAPLSGMCQTLFGFHAAGSYAGVAYALAVTPECPEAATGFPESENLELVVSHEVVEAALDPYSALDGGATGWRITDPASPWFSPVGGEAADMCEDQIDVEEAGSASGRADAGGGTIGAGDGGLFASRVWSNSQAARGTGSPCLPAPTDPYFNVSPSPDAVHAVAAGQSATIPLTGWSTAPVAPWFLYEMAYFGDFDPNAQFPDGGVGNGTAFSVTVSVPAGTPSGSRTQAWIGSYAEGASDITGFWPIAVQVP